MPKGYRDGKPCGRPRRVAPPDAVTIKGKPHVEVTCPSCGQKRLVICYRPIGKCRNCNLNIVRKVTHGLSRTRLYRIWANMMSRCGHKEGKPPACSRHYAGRGITVCEEWRQGPVPFVEWALANGYQPGLTIERKDNNRGYSPDNSRWATRAEQARNTRVNRLTPELVTEIKRRLAAGEGPTPLALSVGIPRGQIYQIRNGKAWVGVGDIKVDN